MARRSRKSKLGGRRISVLQKLLWDGDVDSLSGNEWVKLMLNDGVSAARYSKICQWNTLVGGDWVVLLEKYPSMIDKMPDLAANKAALVAAGLGEMINASELTGAEWVELIDCVPSCLRYCDLEKLSPKEWSQVYQYRMALNCQ